MNRKIKKRLANWDYSDPINNVKSTLINFQKSALGLEVVNLDEVEKIGEFANDTRKSKNRDVTNTATLHNCDCKTFVSRKNVIVPCMHIYRLAMELGILVPTHFKSTKSQYIRLTEEEKAKRRALRRKELIKLRSMPKEKDQWGSWNRSLHLEKPQQERILRAFEIRDTEPETIRKNGSYWIIHDYGCSYEGCECDDFNYRQLPCKHMYTAAFVSQENVTILEEYI